MKADKLQRLTTAHGRTAQPKAPRTPKTAAAAALEPNKDLDNHATQERIRNPEGCDVQLSYATLHLYPPSIAMRRRVYGFCSRIIADAGSTLAPNQSIYAIWLSSSTIFARRQRSVSPEISPQKTRRAIRRELERSDRTGGGPDRRYRSVCRGALHGGTATAAQSFWCNADEARVRLSLVVYGQ
jgi:hypothetical protein